MLLRLMVSWCAALSSLGLGLVSTPAARGQDRPAPQTKFDLETLSKTPEIFAAPDIQAEGVRALFYSGPTYHGRPTRVFAYYGVPSASNEATPVRSKFPAMVLIHGGGGTAFDRWVKLWNSRGYAAIAMDVCGCVPVGTYGNWQRHEHGGPAGWDASFSQLDEKSEDQWTMQAVSAVVLAHTLLRSFPEVDAERIGVTGISWGGYLTCITAGVDPRFRAAAPVYGCGFLGENSAWLPQFEKLGSERAKLWLSQWDPANYLPNAQMPMLWVNGTNDFAYPLDSWQRSYRLPKTPRTLCLRVRMPHGHGPAGENPQEIHTFMDSLLKGGEPLANITDQTVADNVAVAHYKTARAIVKVELCFTRATGKWQDRLWETAPAQHDATTSTVQVEIPTDATAFYINLFDDHDNAVSTEHVVR